MSREWVKSSWEACRGKAKVKCINTVAARVLFFIRMTEGFFFYICHQKTVMRLSTSKRKGFLFWMQCRKDVNEMKSFFLAFNVGEILCEILPLHLKSGLQNLNMLLNFKVLYSDTVNVETQKEEYAVYFLTTKGLKSIISSITFDSNKLSHLFLCDCGGAFLSLRPFPFVFSRWMSGRRELAD